MGNHDSLKDIIISPCFFTKGRLPWFFQEVPPTGEILKNVRKTSQQILKLPCCRMANINFALTFKAKLKLFSSPFSPSFREKKSSFRWLQKVKQWKSTKKFSQIWCFTSRCNREDPTSNGSYKDSRCRALRVGQRPLVQLHNAMEWSI